MVKADYRLPHERLQIGHMRLMMGTSMGAMHSWVCGETYPDFMDALMPLASAPVEIAGRNRMLRSMIMTPSASDPGLEKRRVHQKPLNGLIAADSTRLTVMTSSPLQMLKQWPTHAQAGRS